jgi:hypothetical protein
MVKTYDETIEEIMDRVHLRFHNFAEQKCRNISLTLIGMGVIFHILGQCFHPNILGGGLPTEPLLVGHRLHSTEESLCSGIREDALRIGAIQ